MTRLFRRATILDRLRPRGRGQNLLGAGVVLVCLASTTLVAAAPAAIRTAEVLPGLNAVLRADGSLELSAEGSAPVFTLQLENPDATGVRRRYRAGDHRHSTPHVAQVVEGCRGGHRGPSARADDDGDGLFDEDPLDGRDNDGDGAIDEDFAAISDAMTTVDLPDAMGGGHLEYYNWAHARLRSTAFVSARGAAGSRLVLETSGTAWGFTQVGLQQHSVTGRPVAREVSAAVSQLDPEGSCDGTNRWLGVVVLARPPGGRIGTTRIDDRQLTVMAGDESVDLAVCVAGSWLQLSRMLTDAQRIRDGVADPMTGAAIPWVVAPVCPTCRSGTPAAYRWRLDRQGGLVLAAVMDGTSAGLPDPDLFRLGSRRLGSPAQITWRPAGGAPQQVPWFCAAGDIRRGQVHPGDPYAALAGVRAHGAQGRLEFRFPDPSPALVRALSVGAEVTPDEQRLELVAVDGRALVAELGSDLVVDDAVSSAVALARTGTTATTTTVEAATEQGDRLRNAQVRPSLSPHLLQGWPNPFHDVINLRFEIPATIGEAFRWSSSDDRPANLDPAAPVPWKSGIPEASVKIYTMSGQHLVTLHAGSVGSGAVNIQWDATDSFGRRVASGSYICKLQLDDWSVARRLTFVR